MEIRGEKQRSRETHVTGKVFQNGLEWQKADFHLHTKVDKQFSYDGDDSKFTDKFVQRLVENRIGVGIITNHNKFNRKEFKSLKSKARAKGITLLPGVELSIKEGKGGIHALIVFSDEWIEGEDSINPFLTSVFQGKTPNQYENEDGRTECDLKETIKRLDLNQREYFIVFAHVEDKNGLWSELSGSAITDIGKNKNLRRRILGFQKVRTYDKSDKPCRKKVKDWLSDWYPAEVEGSDPKDLESVGNGSKHTWIRIGDSSFEAVRFALTDHENRVRPDEPERAKHSHIKSISFTGGILHGQEVHFSSALNTLIGIRGSGKSSILEAIRYVLDIPFGENANDISYKENLVEHTLGSGGVAVINAVDNFGEEYQIKRILNNQPDVMVDGKLRPGVSIRETVVRHPVYYGQKDLASSGEGFRIDFVEKLMGERLVDIRHKIEHQRQAVKDLIKNCLNSSNIDGQIDEYTKKRQDAEFKLERYAKHGVAEKLAKQTNLDKDIRRIKEILADVLSFIEQLEEILTTNEDSLRNHITYKSSDYDLFFTDLFEVYKPIVDFVDTLKTKIIHFQEIYAQLEQRHSKFGEIEKKLADDFAEVRRDIEVELKNKGAETLQLEEFPQLKNLIDSTKKMLTALKKQKEQRSFFEEELNSALSLLDKFWHDEFKIIRKELEKINKKDSAIEIIPEFKGNKEAALEFMKDYFRSSHIHGSTLKNLTDNYDDFIKMYQDYPEVKSLIGGSEGKFTEYFFEYLEDFLTYRVPDKFTIMYQGKELEHHSLGQRASALILFVLNQNENDLVLIDQPEDDLDNQTIYKDVITLVRQLKPGVQFIFATHNANFPVLGDADLIHSCRYSDNKVNICSGSIDAKAMQKEIVDIMEGGEAAFARRKEIYGIWKPLSS